MCMYSCVYMYVCELCAWKTVFFCIFFYDCTVSTIACFRCFFSSSRKKRIILSFNFDLFYLIVHIKKGCSHFISLLYSEKIVCVCVCLCLLFKRAYVRGCVCVRVKKMYFWCAPRFVILLVVATEKKYKSNRRWKLFLVRIFHVQKSATIVITTRFDTNKSLVWGAIIFSLLKEYS